MHLSGSSACLRGKQQLADQKLAKGARITKEYLDSVDPHHWFDIRLSNEEISLQLEQIKEGLAQKRKEFDAAFDEKKKTNPGR